jgi:hypothetical protein
VEIGGEAPPLGLAILRPRAQDRRRMSDAAVRRHRPRVFLELRELSRDTISVRRNP